MTPPRSLRWWDPRYPMDVMTAVWSAATLLPPVNAGTGAAYQALFLALRRVILGRTLTMDAGGEQLSMTVTEVVSLLGPLHLIQGRLDIRLMLTQIHWGEREFGDANVVLRNVVLRPGTPPVVQATPLELTLTVPSPTIDALVRDARPEMSVAISDDAVARLHWARRPGWANVELDVELDAAAAGPALRLSPRAVNVAGRRVNLPGRTQSYLVPLARLPADLRLTEVRTCPAGLHVRAVLPRWRASR